MRYLTVAEVAVIHARLIQRTGGAAGLRDLGRLEAAVARPQAAFEGAELYPTVWDKAAALMESLIRNHPFIDGNKRVALVAVGLFLERNGHVLRASNAEVYAFTLQMARSEVEREAAAAWLRVHSTPARFEEEDG
ncbi:MAG: type II toxin-antitoxin system death-on-curing family toxin [Anaerolineae bacterium]